ncbi:MAG: valine--tRNA ligase [Sulfolobales archaeon]|nr:valine--tRNA ligase [Sulfolobales archaeon]
MISEQEVLQKMNEWPKHYDPSTVERKWQERWLSKEFYEKVFRFREEDVVSPVFVIDTPPPFTSGELHMGHAYWVTIADAIARFKRLEGYNVLLPQGWDTQGLPTELKVQYKLGIPKEKKDLFLQKCVEWTEEMISRMKTAMMRLGYRPEWERFEYKTYSNEYRTAIQRSLIKMHEMGLVEMREGPVIWCPKCETALAQSEIGYLEREGILAYIRFPLADGSGDVIIATTRPELVGATQAIAVHPEDERYKGLVGKQAIVPLFNRKVPIIADESVEKEFGTGAVMISTYGDPQDIKWQLKYNLPVTILIDEKGRMKNTNGLLDGLKVEEARKKMLDLLKKEGYLVKVEKIKHNVLSHTERSDCLSPVEFLVKKQIYIKVLPFRDKLLNEYKRMQFHPERMSYYLEEWIRNLEWDWSISRQRVYGTPLPFWYCDNGHLVPAKENMLPVTPEKSEPPVDKCPVCGAPLKPVTDVADVWIDSSITALYISGYFDNPERFKRAFPTSLRLQGTDIIRTWLFYTLFRTLILAGDIPFKDVLINGQVLGPDGTRMSKSKGNVVSPLDRIDEFGADAIRLTLLDARIGDDFPFKWENVRGKKLLLQKLWNASRLAYPFIGKKRFEKPERLHPIDAWILARHRKFVETVVNAYRNYDFYVVVEQMYSYFWQTVADEYLELVKYRLFQEDLSAFYTLSRILKDIIVLLHPIAPHITEEIYSLMWGDKISVQLERLPDVSDIEYDKRFEEFDTKLRSLTSAIRTAKIKNRIPLSAPVKVTIRGPKDLLEFSKSIETDLMRTFRIEEISYQEGEALSVELSDHGSLSHNSAA